MIDSIYTIPIKDVFEPKDGCPVCRLRDTLETRCVEYILGAAMMEPDIRIKTNELGFCRKHFNMMFNKHLFLSLTLTRLKRIYSPEKTFSTRVRKAKRWQNFPIRVSFVRRLTTLLKRLSITSFTCGTRVLNSRNFLRSNPFYVLNITRTSATWQKRNSPKRSSLILPTCVKS